MTELQTNVIFPFPCTSKTKKRFQPMNQIAIVHLLCTFKLKFRPYGYQNTAKEKLRSR